MRVKILTAQFGSGPTTWAVLVNDKVVMSGVTERVANAKRRQLEFYATPEVRKAAKELSRANTPGVGRPVRMIMRLAGTRGSVPPGPPVDGPDRPGRSPDPGHGWAGVVRALDVAGDH